MKPLCFVLMPFGTKRDTNGNVIEFDEIYEQVIRPATEAADMEPIRADEEIVGGIIHKPMFERLIICEYGLADVTTANPNVLYELGIRHAFRPRSTLIVYAKGHHLPFDVAPLRALPYTLNVHGFPANADEDRCRMRERLVDGKKPQSDSPLYQLIDGLTPQEVDREKTDIFRDRVDYSRSYKDRLREARQQGVGSVQAIEEEFDKLGDVDAGIIIDLFLSYRAVEAWDRMVQIYAPMWAIIQAPD